MNSFNQLNTAALFLQSSVVIIKLVRNDELLSVLPYFIQVFIALLLLHFHQKAKHKNEQYTILLLLLNLSFINMFETRNPLISFMKYLLIGKFIGKYCVDLKPSIAILIVIASTFLCEGLLYEPQMYYTFALFGWFIIFFPMVAIFWRKKLIVHESPRLQEPTCRNNREGQPLQESIRLRVEQSMDQHPSDYPDDFYKQMLQMYPEGILILGQQMEVKFMSSSLKRLLGTAKKLQIVKTIMGLKNSQEEIKEQERMNNVFQALTCKMNSKAEIDEENDLLEPIELQSVLSSAEDVKCEYDRIMAEMQKQLHQNQQFIDSTPHKMQFLYEVAMICRNELTVQQFEKSQTIHSSDRGPTLFEVCLRPFVFNNQPYIFTILKDVTHFNKIKVLQAINQNKSEMLAQVSHEFRTPLNCIMILVETLQAQLTQEQVEEFLQPIMISTGSLLSLINDLLDVAQLKAGKFKLVHSEIDLKKMILEIEKFLSPQLSQKGNQLKTFIGNCNTKIQSDPNRIRQIIYNLIGNANKFTTKGEVLLKLEKTGPQIYQVSIKDTGVGIEKEDQTKLFKAFGKLDKNKEMNAQGVGLGLMISNVLAERLSLPEGTETSSQNQAKGLTVSSEGVGMGTTFSFLVYDQTDNHIPKNSVNTIDNMSQSKQSRFKTRLNRQFCGISMKQDLYIMIVDDEPFNVMALQRALSTKFTVDGFYSGKEAIERVMTPLPNHTIILQDIEMPMLDGFQVTQYIKRIVDNNKIYIIGCSGHSKDMRQKCLDNGMDNYIQKPVRLADLMKIIDSLF